jgi:hypothetical protein
VSSAITMKVLLTDRDARASVAKVQRAPRLY